MASIPNERGLKAAPSRQDQVAPHVEAFAKLISSGHGCAACVHALADRKAFTPQDLPSLCVALDLMRGPTRRRASSGDSELPAVAQRLHVPGGVGNRSRAGITALYRFYASSRVERDRERHGDGRVNGFAAFVMHGVELVSVDLDAAARQFAFDRDRLEAALGKLRLQRLLVDARHWSAMCGPRISAAHHTGAEPRRSMVSQAAVDTDAAQHHVFSFPPQLVG